MVMRSSPQLRMCSFKFVPGARALIGASQVLSSAIALSLTKGGSPEFWFTLRALSVARDFLIAAPESIRQQFFQIASRFRGTLHQVRGPASALSHLLCNMGWQITCDGLVHVSAFQSFPLLGTSLQRFRRAMILTWQDGLVKTHTSRWGWFQYPDIDLISTTKVLNQFNDGQRRALIREIAGGSQLASQKAHWLDSSDGTCQFCGQPDSRSHRILSCPIGAEIRLPFQPVLDRLVEDDSCLLDFPVVLVDFDLLTLHSLHFALPAAIWSSECLDRIQDTLRLGFDLHWYTDGACCFPDSPLSRHSAFAVIWDLCHHDAERQLCAGDFLATGIHPETFQVAATARTPGEQDILRAELQAVTESLRSLFTLERAWSMLTHRLLWIWLPWRFTPSLRGILLRRITWTSCFWSGSAEVAFG